MRNHKVIKSGIVGSFAGLAAIPGLFYALVVQPVQSVQSTTTMSSAKQDEVLKSASSTGKLLFALGVVFLVALIAFIVIGMIAREREAQDDSGA